MLGYFSLLILGAAAAAVVGHMFVGCARVLCNFFFRRSVLLSAFTEDANDYHGL